MNPALAKHPYLKTALDAGQAAQKLIQASNYSELKIRSKTGPGDIVTQLDLASEACIREIILRDFPDHSILGEEGGLSGNSPYRWILDPIDGTSNFARGIPHFCVSIALEQAAQGELGVIVNPSLNETYYAVKHLGACKNTQPLRVSKCQKLIDAFVSMSFSSKPADLVTVKTLWDKLLEQAQTLRRMGSTALELAYLAEGKLDAFIGFGQSPWDLAAGIVLVEEAGGFALFDESKGLCLAAASKPLFDELQTLIKKASA